MLSSQAFFARLAATAARALLFIYAITIAAQALPLKVFAMDWQISMISVITNSSILPLQGLVLAHLAAYLDPSEPRFEVFCQNLRRWALPATLGFLLIIPLQSYNFVKGIRNYRQNAAKNEFTITQTFGDIRNAVESASTTADLQKRLADLNAPGLSPADRIAPLPAIRPTLLAEIKKAEKKAKANISQQDPEQFWLFSKQMVGSILAALVFAFAFAAAAKRSAWPESLLVRFIRYLGWLREFKSTILGQKVDNFKAKQKAQKDLALTQRSLQDHARKEDQLKKREDNETRLREKHIKAMRDKAMRDKAMLDKQNRNKSDKN
jgi:hypothetical protein